MLYANTVSDEGKAQCRPWRVNPMEPGGRLGHWHSVIQNPINNIMQNSIKVVLAGALLAVGVAQAKAAEIIRTINQVQNFTFTLTATLQGGVTTNASWLSTSVNTNVAAVAVTTKDVIAALGRASSTNFSSKARLLRITPQTGFPTILFGNPFNNKTNPYIVVRDIINKTAVDFDVTSNFQREIFGSVTKSATARGKTTGTISSSDGFMFQAGSILKGTVWGFSTCKLETRALSSTVTGTGALTNAPCLFKGRLSLSGEWTEEAWTVGGGPFPEPIQPAGSGR